MSQQAFITQLQQMKIPKDGMHPFREKSWERLNQVGLPDKSHEAFKYVPLRELYQTSFEGQEGEKFQFEEAILPECKHSYLVFVDGEFVKELSDVSALPPQTVVLPLDEAFHVHGNFLQRHISRTLQEENDPFALLNLALHSKGVFFYLPPKLEMRPPVQALYLFRGRMVAAPRIHVNIGNQSRVKWICTSHGKSHFILPAMEISLEEGAELDLFNCPQGSWYMESIRANLKKRARLHSFSFTHGAKAVRQSYRIHLKGEECEAHLDGLAMLGEHRTAHVHAVVEHEAAHTRSMQLFKAVLDDFSQSSFEGKILVRKEAQKTEAYQLNKNLLLHQGAVANSKPNLEIFADDVKASHGATISQLDREQLFYFKTRGMDQKEASRLLIQGFCREMIDRIPYASLRSQVEGGRL